MTDWGKYLPSFELNLLPFEVSPALNYSTNPGIVKSSIFPLIVHSSFR